MISFSVSVSLLLGRLTTCLICIPNPYRFITNAIIWLNKFCITVIYKSKVGGRSQGQPKSPFSLATTPKCREGLYFIPSIALFFPWSVRHQVLFFESLVWLNLDRYGNLKGLAKKYVDKKCL